MRSARDEIADILRGRLLRGLQAGSIKAGDRLPSARELRGEFSGRDHRIILDAYRLLEAEGLVSVRARGGIYVEARPSMGVVPLPSAEWISEVMRQGIAREIPLPEVGHWITQAATTLRIRVVAIQESDDQIAGLCRELEDDYGLECSGLELSKLSAGELPNDLLHAHIVVTTEGLEPVVGPIANRLGKPLVVADVRPDLIGGEWRLLMRKELFVVVADEKFVGILRKFLEGVPGAGNVRYLVAGRDLLDGIPDEAPVYVTRAARKVLGRSTVRGRLLPGTRVFSAAASRRLIEFIVRANLRALASTADSGVAGRVD